MTQTSQLRVLAFATAAVASVGLAMIAQSGSASAKSIKSCKGLDRQSVVECCETLVLKKGRPLWMVQTGRNCTTPSVVVCKGGSRSSPNGPLTHATVSVSKNRCFIRVVVERETRDHQPPEIKTHDKTRDTRSPNDRPNNGPSTHK